MNSAGLKPRGSRPISATTRGRQTAGQTDRLRQTDTQADRRLISLSWRADLIRRPIEQCNVLHQTNATFRTPQNPRCKSAPCRTHSAIPAGPSSKGRLPYWARGALRSVPACAKTSCSSQCAAPFDLLDCHTGVPMWKVTQECPSFESSSRIFGFCVSIDRFSLMCVFRGQTVALFSMKQ